MRYHFTLTGIAVVKKMITSVGEGMEKLEPSYPAEGDVKWYSHFRKQFGSASKS